MASQPSYNSQTVRKIWRLLASSQRRSAVVLLGLMCVSMVMETLGVAFIIPAISLLTQDNIADKYPALQPVLQFLGDPSRQTLVIGGMLVLVSVFVIKNSFLTFYAWWQQRFAFGIKAELSQRLFTTYLRQPYAFHLQRNSAQLIRNVVREVDEFIGNVLLPSLFLLTESLVVFGMFALLFAVEPLGSLIVVTVLGISGWIFFHITRSRIVAWGITRQRHEGLRFQDLQQGLGGAKDVKLLGRESDFLDQFCVHNTEIARVGRLIQTLQQLPRLWIEVLAVTGIATLAISMLVLHRETGTVLPTLALFCGAAFRLMPSVNRILSSLQLLRYGLPVIDMLHEELSLAVPEVQKTRANAVPFLGALEFKGVTFTYTNAAKPALRDISLVIRRGESVGFIGATGAGKSTLVDVLLGLLAPSAGEVRVDGNDIQPALRRWQDQVGYVSQSIFLTDDTLRRNIAFGIPNARIDETAVWSALRAAQLEDFVRELPEVLDTMVGERGIRLSGGQRQRIGIARALYHDPPVLVLDEATSSLDTATERGVMDSVGALQGEKTLLIVAHRLSTVERCDRLYRLEEGIVVEEGTPDTMLQQQPRVETRVQA